METVTKAIIITKTIFCSEKLILTTGIIFFTLLNEVTYFRMHITREMAKVIDFLFFFQHHHNPHSPASPDLSKTLPSPPLVIDFINAGKVRNK